MENSKLDKIIEAFRNYKNLKEEMMAVGNGGYTGSGDPKIKAGFDPVMGLTRRKKYASLGVGSRKRWMKKKPSQ
jgi:hypothetical protein